MKRRHFMKSLTALSAVPVVARAQPNANAMVAPLSYSPAEDAADPVSTFLDETQFATLVRLARILTPPRDGMPGAAECSAPEFLDFLLSRSDRERQDLYTDGLDDLNRAARRSFNVSFAGTDDTQADTLLEPLSRPWSYRPKDALERFLRTAARELDLARVNSRQTAVATGDLRTVRWLAPLA